MPSRTVQVTYTSKEIQDLIIEDAKKHNPSQAGGVQVEFQVGSSQDESKVVGATVIFKSGGKA